MRMVTVLFCGSTTAVSSVVCDSRAGNEEDGKKRDSEEKGREERKKSTGTRMMRKNKAKQRREDVRDG